MNMTNIERLLTVSASLITVASFIASLFKSRIEVKIGSQWIQKFPLSARLLIFVIIYSMLNLGFGFLMQRIVSLSGPIFFASAIAVSFGCAWVTVFNIAIILRIKRNEGLFALTVIIFGIPQLITNGISMSSVTSGNMAGAIILLQIVAFIICGIVIAHDDTFDIL